MDQMQHLRRAQLEVQVKTKFQTPNRVWEIVDLLFYNLNRCQQEWRSPSKLFQRNAYKYETDVTLSTVLLNVTVLKHWHHRKGRAVHRWERAPPGLRSCPGIMFCVQTEWAQNAWCSDSNATDSSCRATSKCGGWEGKSFCCIRQMDRTEPQGKKSLTLVWHCPYKRNACFCFSVRPQTPHRHK